MTSDNLNNVYLQLELLHFLHIPAMLTATPLSISPSIQPAHSVLLLYLCNTLQLILFVAVADRISLLLPHLLWKRSNNAS